MSLTRVSPALFQVSNNITSVTVGGSANTISLTFDSNGVITGASNNALSVANTQITGLIEAAQIGSANASLATSGTLPAARLPAGSVLQVVQGSTDSQLAITSVTYADITGLSASITPISASNKILVRYRINGATSGASYYSAFQIVRNSTAIGNGAQGTTKTKAHSSERGQYSDGNPYFTTSGEFLDSPSTTSSVTYKIQTSTNGTTYINRAATNSDLADYSSTLCSITLMEIAG